MADKVSVFNRLCYGSSSPGTVELMFLDGSSLGLAEGEPIDPGYHRGTRSHTSERVRQNVRRAEGSLIFAPTPIELDTLLPLILGANESTDTFALAETLPAFYLGADRDGTLYNYPSQKVNSATFECSEGGPMVLTVNTIGTDETVTGSFPSVSADVASQPYVLSDAALTIGGVSYSFRSFSLSINNALEVVYRSGALTPAAIVATDRVIQVSLALPLGDASAAYSLAVASSAAVVLSLTNGARSITFTMAAVHANRQPIPFGTRGVTDFTWTGTARRTSGALELVTVSDSTG